MKMRPKVSIFSGLMKQQWQDQAHLFQEHTSQEIPKSEPKYLPKKAFISSIFRLLKMPTLKKN